MNFLKKIKNFKIPYMDTKKIFKNENDLKVKILDHYLYTKGIKEVLENTTTLTSYTYGIREGYEIYYNYLVQPRKVEELIVFRDEYNNDIALHIKVENEEKTYREYKNISCLLSAGVLRLFKSSVHKEILIIDKDD